MLNAMIIALEYFKYWSQLKGVDFKGIRFIESKDNAFGFKIQCFVIATNKDYEVYIAVDNGEVVIFSDLKEL